MKKNKILFITYDGLCDQLGQSQIIPYFIHLRKKYEINILSFEKKNNLNNDKINFINKNFKWTYQIFKTSNFKFIKLLDYLKMFYLSIYLIKKNNITLCHGRGFIPSLVIFFIKFFINIKFIFDIRGFWPDERLDNNQLNIKKIKDKLIYKALKILENKLMYSADHIVVLTNKAKKIVNNYNNKITVIPCSTDFSLFNSKEVINHNFFTFYDYEKYKNKKIFCYLGSTKGAYMYEEILRYYKLIQIKYKYVCLFVITKDIDYSNKILSKRKFDIIRKNVEIISIERNQLPYYLVNFYAMITFIKNSYARNAMSPVKVSEAFASNLPVIINNNIGDTNDHIKKFNIGISVDIKNIKSIKQSIINIGNLTNKNYLRNEAYEIYDISKAVKKYLNIYATLI